MPRSDAPRERAASGEVAGLGFVLVCSLLRFGLFAFRSERFGVDPALALAASVTSAYHLTRLARALAR